MSTVMKTVLYTLLAALVGPLEVSSTECDASSYYPSSLDSLDGAALKSALHSLIEGHTVIPYTSTKTDTWDALAVLDRDPANPSNVVLVYSLRSEPTDTSGDSKGWNREHVWPKSYGVGYTGADTSDLHSLRAADWNTNSARNNLYFDMCPGAECTAPAHAEAAPDTAKDRDRFQPPFSQRGDLARSLFYMAVRYDGADSATTDLELSDCPCDLTSHMGVLSTLLRWHTEDPPDDTERTRTSLVCSEYQGNRNPFVDHPEYVARIFQSDAGTCSRRSCTDDDDALAPVSTPAPGPATPQPQAAQAEAGDVALVNVGTANPDMFQIVVLRPRGLRTGSLIAVTDGGWDQAAGQVRPGEGTLTYTVPAPGLAPGAVVTWEQGTADPAWEKSGSFALSKSGDQLIAFAPEADADTPAQLLFAVHMPMSASAAWDEDATDSNSSAEPKSLSARGLAIALPGKHDNFRYTGDRTGAAPELMARIGSVSNWEGSEERSMLPDFDILCSEPDHIGLESDTNTDLSGCDSGPSPDRSRPSPNGLDSVTETPSTAGTPPAAPSDHDHDHDENGAEWQFGGLQTVRLFALLHCVKVLLTGW